MSFSAVDSTYAVKQGVASYTPGGAAGATISANVAAAGAGMASSLDQGASAITALSSTQDGVAASAFYTADGLLQGNATSAGDSVLQQAVDKEIVAALSAKAVGAGVYNGAGVLESLPYSRVTDLGSLLRYNPQLSYIQVGNSYNQGILESVDIVA